MRTYLKMIRKKWGKRMKIESCRFFNAKAKSKINLIEFLKSNFEQTDSVIKYFNKLKPKKLEK